MPSNSSGMRFPRLALAASATLVAGLFVLPSQAAEVTTTHGCIASVPEPGTATPVQICYSLFRPASATADNPVPLVFHSHGWGGSRTRTASSFASYLDSGFGVLSFDQRGFGQSGGKAHVENPDIEGQDVIGLVDLVDRQEWVADDAPGDPVIGAIGGSYGGGYQFVGAFTELRDRGATRFNALAPEITWWDLKESLAPQEVPRSAWNTALMAAGGDAHTDEVVKGFTYGAATGDWAGPGDVPGVDLDAFFRKNGPKWHVSQGRRLDIPVIFGQGLTDNLFNLNQGLKNYDRALTPAARAQSIFVGYNGGHTLPSAVPAGFGTAGDPCSKKLGSPSFAALAQRFLTQHLKGVDTGLTGEGVYHLATAAAECVTVDSVTPNRAAELGRVLTPSAAGAPLSYELVKGPVRIAGQPQVEALVTSLGLDQRAFFALSVGSSPATARVVQNNTMPLREPSPVTSAARRFELPAVAVDVPAGQSLFLTVSPVADMFGTHGSRTPGALVLDRTRVELPVVGPKPDSLSKLGR